LLGSTTALQLLVGTPYFKVFHNQAGLSHATERVAVPPQAWTLFLASCFPNAASATMVGFWKSFHLLY
jgi:hypothetical protein